MSIVLATLLSGYIVAASLFLVERKQTAPCAGMQIVVRDSLDKHFVNEADLSQILRKAGLDPMKRNMDEINTEKIESVLQKNDMIAEVEAYKTPSGKIKLEVTQKMPILRVMTADESYYIDHNGTTMPISRRYVAQVPIVTGYVEKEFARNELYKFALFLRENAFWDNQIEQICVFPNRDVELIPRLGRFRIVLGPLTDFEEKLHKLKLFYDQAIPKVGWEKYSVINLEYKNQIVCTKK